MLPREVIGLMRPPAKVPSEGGSRRTQRERSVADAATLEDVRRLALRYWPRGVRDYVEGGADDEVTLGRNRAAYLAATLHPAVLRDVDAVDLTTTILGRASALPIVLSPTGYTRMMHPGAEAAVARAAGNRSVPYVVSTMATTTVEDIAAAAGTDLWFQLYRWRDRALSYALMERAWEAGFRALVVTVDTPVTGLRVRDTRNGFTIPPRITPRTALDMAAHPAWSLAMLRGEVPTFANVAAERGGGPMGVMAFSAAQFDPTTNWADLAEIRRRWPGAILLKGVLRADDAVRAFGSGVDAVVLSNHGGRQLDRAATPLQVLPHVRAAVGEAAEVHVDSGIRSGVDVAVALAAGADAVGIGRPYLYGLGAAGQLGVEAVLDILSAGLARTMRLLGVTSVAELRAQGPSMLTSPALAPSPSGG